MSDRAVERLERSIDELISTKFILSVQAVSNLLRLIATEDRLFSAFSESLTGFDYEVEMQKACIETERGVSFHLPYGKMRIVALVTRLLYSFDAGEVNFVDFLEKHFEGESANSQYERFCRDVLVPYKEAFVAVLSGEYAIGSDDLPVEPEKKDNPVPTGAVVQIEYIIREINAKIMDDNVLEKGEKENLLLLTDGINRALECRDQRLLKGLIVGLKYALSENGKFARRIKDIEACLKLYLVM